MNDYDNIATAIMLNDKKDVIRLLDQGVDVEIKNEPGQTPLHQASLYGHKEIIELLLARGADINLADDIYGYTPMCSAIKGGHKETVKLLLDKGVDIESKDKCDLTPLSFAIIYNKKEMAEFLLDNGADVNTKDKYGDSPLHLAACKCTKEMVELLLAKGADPKAKNKNGVTPIVLCFDREIIQILMEAHFLTIKNSHIAKPPHKCTIKCAEKRDRAAYEEEARERNKESCEHNQ